MKKLLSLMFAIAVTIGAYAAGPKKSAEAFKIDAGKSSVKWLAKKVTGQHNGSVNVSDGTITVSGEKITGGTLNVDMSSLIAEDLEGEWKGKLEGHLKSDDFFSVDKFPVSKFEITKVTEKNNVTTIEGNLTIKGITKPISFPASVSKKGNVIVAIATIMVNRANYDIKYRSKSFFENLGDNAIDDEFELKVNIVALK